MELYNHFLLFSKQNPVVSGVVGLWGLTVVTYCLRTLPMQTLNKIKRWTTTHFVYNSYDNYYDNFAKTITEKINKNWVRNLCIGNNHNIVLGYGTTFLWFDNHLIFITKNKEEANDTNQRKETIYISSIGRSHRPIEKLVKLAEEKSKNMEELRCYQNQNGYWHDICKHSDRDIETVVLPDEQLERIVNHIDNFNKSRDYYKKHDFPIVTGKLQFQYL